MPNGKIVQLVSAVALALVTSSCGPSNPADHPIMHWTGATRELANEIRQLMNEGDADDMAALRLLDEDRPSLAIDAEGRVACLLDVPTGRCHVVQVPSRPSVTSPTADAELLAAMQAALPSTETRSFTLKTTAGSDESRRFSGVHVVAEDADRTSFVLRPVESVESWVRYDVRFSDGTPAGYYLHDVTDDDLARWRQEPSWPEGW